MKVKLAYGDSQLEVEFPSSHTRVIEPRHTAGLPDEKVAFIHALEHPVAAPPLRQLISKGAKVCILFTDKTRATPNERIIPWLLEHLDHVPRENLVLLNQLGTHRPNTPEELDRMLTPEVARNYRVVNHEPENDAALLQVGTLRDGTPALINRYCVEADVRIVSGFIEPHFFAGFSGGPKGIMPGVAGLRTVMSNHGRRNIEDPNATFGITAGNPLWEELRDVALRVGHTFLVNVALNHRREIAGVFAGDLLQAHAEGCEFVRRAAMQPCEQPFDLVVTTNSGYPLDLNLYQGVKGMSAGARILKPGGTLLLVCECREGVPNDSSYHKLLQRSKSPEHLLAMLAMPEFSEAEQWQAHIQCLIQKRARVLLHSALPEEIVRSAHLEPCADVNGFISDYISRNPESRIAVLPQGPLTIPYIG